MGLLSTLKRLLYPLLERFLSFSQEIVKNRVTLRFMSAGPHVFFAGPKINIGFPEKIRLHDNITFGNRIFIDGSGGLEIGNNFISSDEVVILTTNHEFDHPNAVPYGTEYVAKPVRIGDNVWVGMRAMILPGTTIGEGAIIGAGAVVSGTVPPLAVMGGNPAKVLKYRDKEAYEQVKRANIWIGTIRNARCKNCRLGRFSRDCMECWKNAGSPEPPIP